MKLLPLYPGPVSALVEQTAPVSLDHECKKCPAGERQLRTVCMAADGEPGGLLVVGKAPGVEEDRAGRPNVGKSGRMLRALIQRIWKGPVAYDNALRCVPVDVSDKDVDACRGYLAGTVAEVKPTRVLALGNEAVYSVLGRSPAIMSVRRGYGWMANNVPVFLLFHPASIRGNRFLLRAFEDDLQWALTTPVPKCRFGGLAKVVETGAEAEAAVAELSRADWFAFDVETCGDFFDSDFRLISIACSAAGSDDAWVWDREALHAPEIVEPLKKILYDQKIKKGGQNVKYDQVAVRLGLGVDVRGVTFDTLLQRKLIDPEAAGALESLAELVGMGGHKEEMAGAIAEATKAAKNGDMSVISRIGDHAIESKIMLGGHDIGRYSYALAPHEILSRYNARDAVSTAALEDVLIQDLKSEPELNRVWEKIVLPAARAVERMERWGIGASREAVQAFQLHLKSGLSAVRARFDKLVGADFNPSSSIQVCELLFGKLRLQPVKTTNTGKLSTDRETLEHLRGHPVVDDLLVWRKFTKLKGTYADGILAHIRSDGRVHPNFRLDGARSGRASCRDPNLQNIPRAKDSPEGKMARDIFVAEPGSVLLEADFSQIELRVAAMLSGDSLMRTIFERGEDYHLRTAQMVSQQAWGITPEQVTDSHRSAAKAINFGVLYGMSDEGLADIIGCGPDQAARIKSAIFGKFTRLAGWIKSQLEYARRNGCTWTWWDGDRARRRQLWQIADQDGERRSRAEHGSWNSAIQGTAADYCTASLASVTEWIIRECVPAKLVLAVHDSLILEVESDCVDEVAATVRKIMTGWPTLHHVPLDVDMKIGSSWGSLAKCEKIKKTA